MQNRLIQNTTKIMTVERFQNERNKTTMSKQVLMKNAVGLWTNEMADICWSASG
jgi:hypothetical protein